MIPTRETNLRFLSRYLLAHKREYALGIGFIFITNWLAVNIPVHIGASIDLLSGERSEHSAADLELAYRHSNLGPDQIVTSASFATSACSRAEAEGRIREITRWRKEHQPGGTFNAGSVFKNPEGDAAGRLIDEAGLKGFRRGGVAVSEIHANFFAADEDATAQDVWDLVWAVRRRVGASTGVWLVPEIRFVGAFDQRGDEATEPETVE
mgnify:CR=1 FL=1